MYRLLRRACAASLLAGLGTNAVAGSFTTLDDAQGGFVSALSRDGHIVSGFYVGGGIYAGSFVWRDGAGVAALPLTAANGMNSAAQPIAGSADDGTGNQVAALAYSDVDTTGPVLIGPYPGSTAVDNFYSQAYGISDNGIAVGLAYDPSGNPIAFRWTAGGGMTRLPVNRPQTYSRANGISGNGSVVYGWNDHVDGYRSGVIWIAGSPVEPHNYGIYGDSFGSPPGEPLGSNYDGSVVVGQGYWDDQLISEAWRWTLATDAQPLGVIIPGVGVGYANLLHSYKVPVGALHMAELPPTPDDWSDDPASYALAVSQDGNTVVGNTGTPINEDAFIWTSATGMMLLSDYAAARGVAIPAGFLLYSANAISADGKTIAGNGIDPTGSFVVPWVLDLHDGSPRDILVTAEGSIASNDLVAGPFVGYPVGAAVTMTFRLRSVGTALVPGYTSDYTLRAGSFQINASYVDWSTYINYLASDTLDPATTPVLHFRNDDPRTDGITLDATPLSTSGQTVQFQLTDSAGMLFDSDHAEHVNRSFGPDAFDTANWTISDGINSMTVAVEFVTIKDDDDVIFGDDFGG
jgi:uncharacterized membrane protein